MIKTHLISGAGNTFHIIFGEFSMIEDQRKNLSRRICSENPADGLIFLRKTAEKFSWNFYNNDGSNAEMCGNATRCVGYYINNILRSGGKSWELETVAGLVQITSIKPDTYKIVMTPVKLLNSSLGFFCDTGVPHLVIKKQDVQPNENLKEEARRLRQHPEFHPKGTNVTFVMFEEEASRIKAVSYERGVENFTQACGTGAAAAAAFNLKFRGALQTQVEMPGGTLIMDLSDLQRPIMIGPAVLLGSYEYEITI